MIPDLDWSASCPTEPGAYLIANPFPWGGASYCLVHYYEDNGRLQCSSGYKPHRPRSWDCDGEGLMAARVGSSRHTTGMPLADACYTVNTVATAMGDLGFKIGTPLGHRVAGDAVVWGPFTDGRGHAVTFGIEISKGVHPVVYLVIYAENSPDDESLYETQHSLGVSGGFQPLTLEAIMREWEHGQ